MAQICSLYILGLTELDNNTEELISPPDLKIKLHENIVTSPVMYILRL